MADNDWRSSDELKLKVSLDEIRFIFEQAEKQVSQSVQTSEIVVTRTTILLTAVVTIFSALIGYYASKNKSFELPEMLCGVYLLCLMINLGYNIVGHKYAIIGSEPKLLFDEWYFSTDLDKERRTIFTYACEVDEYQKRITQNNVINDKRWKSFKLSLWGTLLIPIVWALLRVIF